MKVSQALSLHIVDSIHFNLQKYVDSAKLLDDLYSKLPSSLNKFAISYESSICLANEKSKEIYADALLMKMIKRFPKIQIAVNETKKDTEKRIYNIPIMKSFHLDEAAAKNCKN